MADMQLDTREKTFAEEWIKCHGNAKQAALNAGYAESTANDSSKWLNPTKPNGEPNKKFKPHLKAYIDRLNAEAEAKAKEKARQEEAEADTIDESTIADIIEIQETITSILRRQQPEKVALKVMTEVEGYVPAEDGKMRRKRVRQEKPEIVEVPTKNSDVLKAAELLARMKGAFTTDVNINGGLPVILTGEDAIPD